MPIEDEIAWHRDAMASLKATIADVVDGFAFGPERPTSLVLMRTLLDLHAQRENELVDTLEERSPVFAAAMAGAR